MNGDGKLMSTFQPIDKSRALDGAFDCSFYGAFDGS